MDKHKYDRLMELLEQDDICQVYQNSWDELRQRLQKYEKWVPLGLRRLLWGLVEMAELRQSRTLLLVCEHMEFKEK